MTMEEKPHGRTQGYIREASHTFYSRQVAREKEALQFREKDDGAIAPPPHVISVAVNNRCILKCLHCDVGETRRSRAEKNFFYQRGTGGKKRLQQLPLEILKKLTDEVAPFSPVIRPTFLEPLLRHDLFEFAQYVKSKNLTFSLQTNGVLLPQKYKQIVDCGVDVLRVSLDGPRDIHDYIRGVPGTYDRVISGLHSLIAYKRQKQSTRPVLGISFTISSYNYGNIVSFFNMLNEEHILEHVYVAVNFLRFVTQEEADDFNKMGLGFWPMTESSMGEANPTEIDPGKLYDELQQLQKKYPQNLYQYHFFPCQMNQEELAQWFGGKDFLHPEITCHVPWSHCQILYNGDVVINGRCCSPSLGNITEQSFSSIWNGPVAQEFRKKLKSVGNFPVCNRCCRKF